MLYFPSNLWNNVLSLVSFISNAGIDVHHDNLSSVTGHALNRIWDEDASDRQPVLLELV
jgi:hypothetical protein